MHSWIRLPALAFLGLLALTAPISAQNAPGKKAGPKSVEAVTEPLRTTLELNGVFESRRMDPVAVHPEAWAGRDKNWIVVSAVSHGDEVRKGQTLVQFDTEKIDREIDGLKRGISQQERGLEKSRLELEQAKANKADNEKKIRRDLEQAEEAYRRWEEILRPRLEENEAYRVRQVEFRLEGSEEEMRQLKKMYAADDLVEESEEIVLKRQRMQLERMRMSVKNARQDYEHFQKVTLPQKNIDAKTKLRKARDANKDAVLGLRHHMAKLEDAVEKGAEGLERSQERLRRLETDQKAMTVTAPMDGLAYYGSCNRGNFPQVRAYEGKLRKHGFINPGEVFITVVDPTNLYVRTSVPEARLGEVRFGLGGAAIPIKDRDARYVAKIHKIAATPSAPGQFDAEAEVTIKGDSPLPGMTCKLRFVTSFSEDALVIPARMVSNNERNPDVWTVWKLVDGTATKTIVDIGRRTKDKVEILSGLSAGDRVTDKPGK